MTRQPGQVAENALYKGFLTAACSY